jgi:general secretion pathway protein L
MKAASAVAEGFSRWIDSIAGTLAGLLDRLAPPRVVRLVENGAGKFALERDDLAPAASAPGDHMRIAEDGRLDLMPESLAAVVPGSRVELLLDPTRFLFRPLELPARAREFLDGIARSQIDRLTPWTAAEAAFGWSAPTPVGTDRIAVEVAATASALVQPYVRAIADAGAHSVAVFARTSAGAAPGCIKVLEHGARVALAIGRIRSVLATALAGSAFAAAAAVAVLALAGSSLDAQQAELTQRIAAARAAAGTARNIGSVSARRALETRKQQAPASVMLLEALSQILPDHTYVTELRLEAGKLRLTGVTGDAPSLIGLLEQSGHFTRASFFAPTTRSPSEPGERFHIEAQIKPFVRS